MTPSSLSSSSSLSPTLVVTTRQSVQRSQLSRTPCPGRDADVWLPGDGMHCPVLTVRLRWTARGPRRAWSWTCWFCDELREPLADGEPPNAQRLRRERRRELRRQAAWHVLRALLVGLALLPGFILREPLVTIGVLLTGWLVVVAVRRYRSGPDG